MFPSYRPLLMILALATSAPCAAQAQRGGPVLRVDAPVPVAARLPPASRALEAGGAPVRGLDAGLVAGVGRLEVERRLRLHRDVLDLDPRGALMLRGEVVAIDPSQESLDKAARAGYRVVDDSTLEELGLRVVVLRGPAGTSARAALRQLRRLDPVGAYDFNHVYLGSAATPSQPRAAGAPSSSGARSGAGTVRVGLIDSGITPGHASLAGVRVRTWGCGGASHADAHGTAVASLLVGPVEGRMPDSTSLFAADIYCGSPAGGAVAGFVQAMAWMARERVEVINLSLVGAPNKLLERAVQALAARGHVLVAAVGNDGPAAPPLYPAAYPEVIGVTAVDGQRRVLPEAGRGAHVEFAAPGSELRVALAGGGWGTVRGTSFAAPLVAHRAAVLLGRGGQGNAGLVRSGLQRQAVDLGPRGKDAIYGHGLLQPAADARAMRN